MQFKYFETYVKNLEKLCSGGRTFGADQRDEYDFATLAVSEGRMEGLSDDEISATLTNAGLDARRVALVLASGLDTREDQFWGYAN